MTRRSLAPLLAAALVGFTVLPVSAQDATPSSACAAPAGGMQGAAVPGGSESLTGAQPGPAPTSAPVLCWTGTDGNAVLGTRIVAVNDRVFALGDAGEAISFNADGTEAWRVPLADISQGMLGGLASDGTNLYVGTPTGLLAMNPADGSTVWTYTIDPGGRNAASTGVFSPVIAGDNVAALVYTSDSRTQIQRAIVAISRADGSQVWSQSIVNDIPAGALTADGSTVAVAEGDGSLVLRDAATGETQLSVSVQDLGAMVTTPVVLTRDDAIFGDSNGAVQARSRSDGAQKWTMTPTSGLAAAVTANGQYAYINGYTNLYAVDAGTGAQVWEAQMQASAPPFGYEPIPAIVDGQVILGTSDINNPAALIAFDALTGAQVWRTDLPDMYGAIFSPIVLDGRIYAPSFNLVSDGGVLAFGLPG
jgi:outer membrane protein assembly factor BamB